MTAVNKKAKKLKTKPKQPAFKRAARLAWLKTPKKKLFLYAAITTGALVIFWWLIFMLYLPNRSDSAASAYNSLDLSVASKARYSNKPISFIKDIGIQNNVKHELISFEVPKDNLSEYALMTTPTKKPPGGKYPVIILCHGYVNPRAYSTLEDYSPDMEFYSQHGFVVIKPDFRGNGFSVTSGTPDGAYYSMGYNTDVMSLVAAVKKTSNLDKKNISLWGHSMGGYVALRAAVLSADIKNLILLSAPVGNTQDMYSDYTAVSDRDNPVAADIRDQQLVIHGTPLTNPTYWDTTSPINYVSRLHADVQIYASTNDHVVPSEFSQDLNQALAARHIMHQLTIFAGDDHGLVDHRAEIWSNSLKILNRH